MPMKWEPGRNPYVLTYFAKLRLGSSATPRVVIAQAEDLTKRLVVGQKVVVAGVALDEHTINDASARLREPESLAEELLVTHAQPRQDSSRQIKQVTGRLATLASVPDEHSPLALADPEALFWFLPVPEADAVELPEWSALGLVSPGAPQDLALDVVFDS